MPAPSRHLPAALVVALVATLIGASRTRAQTAPTVAELAPAHLACDVDARATARLVVRFDRAMSDGGLSICGSGPKFPKLTSRPAWRDSRTLVVEVALEPDHDYEMSLNCQNAMNLRSAEGVALTPTPWSFSTLPAELPDARAQRTRNAAAFARLTQTLRDSYAYYDLRVSDWDALLRGSERALLSAPTDKVWASVAARMLAPTQDLHMYVQHDAHVFPVGMRTVDSLFRVRTLDRYVNTAQPARNVLVGRTDDGIGYLLIGSWSQGLDLAAIDGALTGLRDTRALIVDVRPNSGGDETLARRVAAWFVDGTVVYAKHRGRVRAGEDGFGPVHERAVTGNADPERRYTAPIAVLTSRCVMSSNESFVLMLRQAPDCTQVGQPTFGSSGNPKPHDLGNDVTLVAPSWQDLRPDGTCFEGEGIVPEVTVDVDPAELDQRDPILEKALEVLRTKLAK